MFSRFSPAKRCRQHSRVSRTQYSNAGPNCSPRNCHTPSPHCNSSTQGLVVHKTLVYRYSSGDSNQGTLERNKHSDSAPQTTSDCRIASETTAIMAGLSTQNKFYGDNDGQNSSSRSYRDSEDLMRVQRDAQAVQMDVVWNQDGGGHVTTVLHNPKNVQT